MIYYVPLLYLHLENGQHFKVIQFSLKWDSSGCFQRIRHYDEHGENQAYCVLVNIDDIFCNM